MVEQYERLEKLLRVGVHLSSTLDLDELLSRIVSTCQDVMDCEGASILLLDKKTRELYFSKVSNEAEAPALMQLRLKLGEGVAGHVAATGIPAVVNHAETDEHFSPKGDQKSGMRTRNLLAVPLKTVDATIGVLEAVNRLHGPFSDSDVTPCLALANMAAVALENAQLHRQLRTEMTVNQELVESKTRLITLLSHELRTPLSCIRGAADVLGRGSDKPLDLIEEMSQMIYSESNHMARIIEDLFLVNELEKKRDTLPVTSGVDIGTVCKEQSAIMQRDFPDHEFTVELEGKAPFKVQGERPRLAHVVLHLLDNAVKAQGEGGPVRVRVIGGEKTVTVTVSDTGIGIPPGHEERIFERFYQVETTDDRSFEGLGLGLFLSKKLITSYGGRITFKSSPGEGSTFSISLPRYTM